MYELPNVPELAPQGIATDPPWLRAVLDQAGSEHDAGAFVQSAPDSAGGDCGGAEGVVDEGEPAATRSAWGEDGGPLIFSHTLTANNGRSVTGMGYTPVAAEEDAMQAWMRGEG